MIKEKRYGRILKIHDPKRRAVPTPKSMVDDKGMCVFGTFDKEFEEMDIVRLKKPTGAPQCMNRLKLTLWEATEVHLKNGVLLAVVCDMGIFGKTLNVFYDKRTGKVYCWDTNLKSKDTIIAPNLTTARWPEGPNTRISRQVRSTIFRTASANFRAITAESALSRFPRRTRRSSSP